MRGWGERWGGAVIKGGVKVYRGTSAEARGYLERDHSGADRYYLGETGGIADILTVTAEGITGSVCVDGAGYEQWVKGLTVDGAAKGRIRGNPKPREGLPGAGRRGRRHAREESARGCCS